MARLCLLVQEGGCCVNLTQSPEIPLELRPICGGRYLPPRNSLRPSGLHKQHIYWRKWATLPEHGPSGIVILPTHLPGSGALPSFKGEVSRYLHRVPLGWLTASD
jgi:hypothetical protein